jgi:hypothetical protein
MADDFGQARRSAPADFGNEIETQCSFRTRRGYGGFFVSAFPRCFG